MAGMIDKELGSLAWTRNKLIQARMTRREFVQLAMVVGIAAPVAENLFERAQAATPKKGGRLRVAISWGSTTNSLDPATYLDNYMFTIALTIGSLLAQVDETGNIGSDLAESFEPSNQAKVWRVTLRKGVAFHDGKPLRPEDVIASVRHHGQGVEIRCQVGGVANRRNES